MLLIKLDMLVKTFLIYFLIYLCHLIIFILLALFELKTNEIFLESQSKSIDE